MQWNDHKILEGKHAFLGASQFRWITWDDKTMEERFNTQYAQQIGDALHLLAHDCIMSRTKLTENDIHLVELSLYKAYIPKRAYDPERLLMNLIPFVNDAIGYHMDSEILLYYSLNCFGTADAIVCNEQNKTVRISDYKSGTTPSHMEQLMIYAALFYLEYKKKPSNYKTILRIYQDCNIIEYAPEVQKIEDFMEMIKSRDMFLNNIKEGKNGRLI